MKNTIISEKKIISVDEIIDELPELKNIKVSKAYAIGEWLCNRIEKLLKAEKIFVGEKLPSKAEFAYRLGVSIGTIQNALKYVEDNDLIEAKPCVGTIIRDKENPQFFNKKNISKRDIVTSKVKKYICDKAFKLGDNISSSKDIASIIHEPINTVRSALENLSNQGILTHKFRKSGEKTGWYMAVDKVEQENDTLKSETLVERAVKSIEDYILEHHHLGERIATHNEFAKMLNSSVSTVHTAFQILIDKGVLMTRRGQYGTYVLKMPNTKEEMIEVPKETSIFAPAAEAVVYYYEKIKSQIKKMIVQNYSVGDKLPAITELAKVLDISPNTVRKSLLALAEEGYVRSERGRYGGTFVTEIPSDENQSFKWLAVNPKFVKAMK